MGLLERIRETKTIDDRFPIYEGADVSIREFDPDEVKDNNIVPSIVISAFKKYGEQINFHRTSSIENHVELSYQDDFFSFEFAALDFTNPTKNQYAYKLEGFDKDWIFCGSRRFANYTNIDGGTYVFRVKGTNNDGIWNANGASIKVIVHPPFWQTWWFRILTLILTIAAIYIIITLRMRSVNAQKRKLELEVAQRTRELNQSNYELLKVEDLDKQGKIYIYKLILSNGEEVAWGTRNPIVSEENHTTSYQEMMDLFAQGKGELIEEIAIDSGLIVYLYKFTRSDGSSFTFGSDTPLEHKE